MNVEALRRPFPPEQIRKREGPVDKRTGLPKILDYVAHPDVIRRLNEAFEFAWSFRIIDRIVMDTEICIHGELCAAGEVKQQWGNCKIGFLGFGDAMKAATSDALKKCATEFEIGLHLIDDDRDSTAVRGAPVGDGGGRRDEPMTGKQAAKIIAVVGSDVFSPDEKHGARDYIDRLPRPTKAAATKFIAHLAAMEKERTE